MKVRECTSAGKVFMYREWGRENVYVKVQVNWDDSAWQHLVSNDTDVPLNLGHPLPQDSKQLRYGGPGVHKNLSTLWVAGVEKGEL